MDFFDFDVSEKDMHAVDYMSRTNRMLISLYFAENKSRKLTKSKIAELLGVDRSSVTKMLKGNANLTERSIGELLWALGYRIEQRPVKVEVGNEAHPEDTSDKYSLKSSVKSYNASSTTNSKAAWVSYSASPEHAEAR